ncbi:MAG TPA: hypothetical protein DDW52_18405 [Planctomycetaceae bacterium]|nr:hypothetical protein [Planctomycetaceae bacterium]
MDEPYFDVILNRGSRNLYRYWTQRTRCSKDDRSSLEAACDAFEVLFDLKTCDRKRLLPIRDAAAHPRKVVWETGTLMLSQLAQEHSLARECLLQLAASTDAKRRLRSFAYLTDDFPRTFCRELVHSRVNDLSEQVAHAASWKAIELNLSELSTPIRTRRKSVKHNTRLLEMSMLADLLDQRYHEYYNDNGYNLVLAFPNFSRTKWFGQVVSKRAISQNSG